MARNVNKFARDLADYINNHIVGTENTKIKHCKTTGEARNRGHMICMELILPEDMENKEMKSMGPVFYAEELLQEFPNNTTGSIAEIINVRVNEYYPSFIAMYKMQIQAADKTIDDCDMRDVILTAVPTVQCNKNESEPFISREDKNLGLILTLKRKLYDDTENKQGYYVPIQKADGHEGTKEQWEIATNNSYTMSKINVIVEGPGMPLFGIMKDENSFYDFFYLLELEKVWSGAVNSFGTDRIYIIPNGAYEAVFILSNPALRANSDIVRITENILDKGVKDLKGKPLPVFVLDCETMQITKYEGQGL